MMAVSRVISYAGIVALAMMAAPGWAGTPSAPYGSNGCTVATQNTEVAQVKKGLTDLIAGLPQGKGGGYSGQGTRDLMNGALTTLLANGAAGKTNAVVWSREAFSGLTTTGTYIGEVPRNVGDTSTTDTNYTEFAVLGLAAMLQSGKLTYADITSTNTDYDIGVSTVTIWNNMMTAMKTLKAHSGGSNPQVPVTYTNMWLMNTMDRVLMDGYLIANSSVPLNGFNPANAAGGDMLTSSGNVSKWLNEVKRQLSANTTSGGIREFDSPTYSGTQLESLVLGYLYVSGTTYAAVHANIKTALDYIWFDLANNYFKGSLRIAPPYARNYDVLAGGTGGSSTSGEVLPWLEVMACWTSGGQNTGTQLMTDTNGNSQNIALEHAALYANLLAASGTAYELEPATYSLAVGGARREIQQAWDSDKSGNSPRRIARLGSKVTLGCASGDYTTPDQDTMIGGMFAGANADGNADQSLAFMSYLLDSSGRPYWHPNTPAGGKPWHLQSYPACAFGGNVALVSFAIDGTQRLPSNQGGDTGLYSNILFPYLHDSGLAAAVAPYPAVRIDNQPLTATTCSGSTTYTCPLTVNGSVVTFTRATGGVLGIKFVESTLKAGSYQLKIEPTSASGPNLPGPVTGYGADAARVVVAHNTLPLASQTTSSNIRVAMVIMMDDSATDPTAVYNTLANATYSASGTPTLVENVTFSPTYRPTDEAGLHINQLQITRDATVLADYGTYMKSVESAGLVAMTPSAENLSVVAFHGDSATFLQASDFWAQSQHAIQ